MSYGTQMMIAYHMFLDYLKSVFESGLHFPTAPSYQPGYMK